MEEIKINQKDIVFALDIGTRSVIGTVGLIEDKKFKVIAEHYVEHEERSMIDGQIHDINKVAEAVQVVKHNLEKQLDIKLKEVAIAAAGRFLRTAKVKVDLNIDEDREINKEEVRRLELTAVKKAEEEISKASEGKLYCVGYSIVNYYLNGYVISNLLSHKAENVGVEVIATFLPRTVVDSLYSVMKKVNLKVISLTLEPIAAIEAAIPKNLRLLNLALVDIGAGTSDIAISSKDSITAFGMVQMAGDEITEAIAQNYLVDFNGAENIKKALTSDEVIKYTDVLGLENQVKSEEVIKLILPLVEKITHAIAHKILELNGGKAPNAVFLVGGGAHTAYMREKLSEKLNIPTQRIGVKGREAVTDCICRDNSLGSVGVTVLGIALMAIKNLGQDFIDVYLNGEVISLFNIHDHKVTEVLLQAGINPKMLIGRNGKNIRFSLNGNKRLAFGSLGKNSIILINGKECSMDSEVKEGDSIEVQFALDGRDAQPKIKEYITKLDSISFFYNDIIQNLDPICMINDEIKDIDSIIKEDDYVEIIYPSTLGEFKTYMLKEQGTFLLKDHVIGDEYIIKEGDRIYKALVVEDKKENNSSIENLALLETAVDLEEKTVENITNDLDRPISKDNYEDNKESKGLEEDNHCIVINVNGDLVTLKGKKEYIFVDIFNYIDFDLSKLRGRITLELNGVEASYGDKLKEGDIIKVYWA
ncbi:cell division protein FtsA [Clostridium amazonitimonense]|uniref:cell division protein FtsA n=1 Tax=Clostridium amazonitimonense TaxID=1499689 RepID=UPI00050955AA|nr:cell division protein FtsA [Clostridium amazonitimonense]